MVPLEGCPNHRQAGNLDRLASEGIPFVLALEVQAGTTSIAEKHPRADCAHGTGESDLGSGTSGRRTLTQTWDSSLTPHGAQILAVGAKRLPCEKGLFTT